MIKKCHEAGICSFMANGEWHWWRNGFISISDTGYVVCATSSFTSYRFMRSFSKRYSFMIWQCLIIINFSKTKPINRFVTGYLGTRKTRRKSKMWGMHQVARFCSQNTTVYAWSTLLAWKKRIDWLKILNRFILSIKTLLLLEIFICWKLYLL